MKPTILFIDCEYNGRGGALISMALVPLTDPGRRFYEVAPPNPLEAVDHWVSQNVLPLIEEEKPQLDREAFAQAMSRYLAQFSHGVHIVADWPEDIELFCRALITGPGERVDTPPLTMEVRRDIDTEASTIPHHALADALALRRSWIEAEGWTEEAPR